MKVKSRGESMKNWEYYKDDIKRYGVDRFSIKKDGTATKCYSIRCKECKFLNDCVMEKTKFLYQEHHEEPIKLTHLEYELLKEFVKEYNYIVRNKASNSLSLHLEKPYRYGSELRWGSLGESYQLNSFFNKFFKFIEWEFQPINIQDILDNCVVIEKMNR